MRTDRKLARRFLCATSLGITSLFASQASMAVQIDVMVVYDQGTNDHYDGSPETAIRSMVDTGNTYYANSDVDIQLNLVGTHLTNVDDSLRTITEDASIAELRDQDGADFVTFLSDSFGACGQGWISVTESRAYNIVSRSCMTRSFVHELGHNMGLGHSVAQNSSGSIYDFGVGWGERGVFSTLMAYNSAYDVNQRTYLLSNPDISDCSGRPCGREDVADSARAITNVLDTISNYRDGGTEPPEGGFLGRTFAATSFSGESNPDDEGVVRDMGQKVGFLTNGSWIRFDDFNFDPGATSIDFSAASNRTGGTIEVRTGSPTGNLIASIDVAITGGWDTFQSFSGNLNATVTGNEDLYFVFVNGGRYVLDLESFVVN